MNPFSGILFSDDISDILLYRLATHICIGRAETFFVLHFDYSHVEVSNAMRYVKDELDIGKLFIRWHRLRKNPTIEEFEELLDGYTDDAYTHKETIQIIRDTIKGRHIMV